MTPVRSGGAFRVWPAMGFWADKNKHGGSWRLWEVARYLDDGSGLIEPARLRSFVMDLGMSKSSFKRWLKDAYQVGLFHAWDIGRGRVLQITSAEKATRLLGVKDIETRRAIMDIEDLFGPGWKARLWDGHRATCNYQPVSRAISRKVTGRSSVTQWRDEKKAGTKVRANIVVYDREANFEWMRYQEVENGIRYTVHREGGKLMLAKRLPNTYVPKKASAWKGGRSRKVKSAIENTLSNLPLSDYSLSGSPWQRENPNSRLYHTSQKQASRGTSGREHYFPRSVGDTVTLWGGVQK